MSRRAASLSCAFSAFAVSFAASGVAAARTKKRTKVIWSSITVRDGEGRERLEKDLAKILQKEAHHANWGDGHDGPVEASVTIRELTSVRDGDVVRVTCTGVGKLLRGASAKSKFSFGGRPQEQEKLEHHILQLVARGIVTRLAEMSRGKALR